MPYITTAKEGRDLVLNKIETNKSILGIGYVGVDDERRLPRYPAVVVSAGPKDKQIHSSNSFAVTIRVLIWVYHAKMNESHRSRSNADLDLADAIENLLEEDLTWSDQVVVAHCEGQIPGVFSPRSEKSDLVIGTRLTWVAATQEEFR